MRNTIIKIKIIEIWKLRCSECAAINIYDFIDDFKFLTYRQAKTNKMIYNDPVPDPLRKPIKAYILLNQHRLKQGFLFPNYTGKGLIHTTECIGAFWSKWRKGIGKTNPRWLDRYDNHRYRIGSHSLRRLHRTVLSKKIKNDWILAKLCHYDDMSSFLRYKNEFEILENSAKHLLPILNPVIANLSQFAKGQTRLRNYI